MRTLQPPAARRNLHSTPPRVARNAKDDCVAGVRVAFPRSLHVMCGGGWAGGGKKGGRKGKKGKAKKVKELTVDDVLADHPDL